MTPKYPARILVVDDDPLLLELLVDTLSAIGYTATPATDGAVALEILNANKFDLMITDIKMPRLDGLQLLKRVKRHYPQMPVLFITGVATQEVIGVAGVDGFLTKPFRIAHIEEMIERVLSKREKGGSAHRPELLVINAAERLPEAFSDSLSAQGYRVFTFMGIEDAMHEIANNEFAAVLADLPSWTVRPQDILARLRNQAPTTPLFVNEDAIPPSDRARLVSEIDQLRLLPAPFVPEFVGKILQTIESVPAKH